MPCTRVPGRTTRQTDTAASSSAPAPITKAISSTVPSMDGVRVFARVHAQEISAENQLSASGRVSITWENLQGSARQEPADTHRRAMRARARCIHVSGQERIFWAMGQGAARGPWLHGNAHRCFHFRIRLHFRLVLGRSQSSTLLRGAHARALTLRIC